MAEDERSSYAMAGMRPEPLLLPPQSCAARLPRGFRRLLDDFAREVLRLQPCDLDGFGAAYFSQLLQFRRGGQSIDYQARTSYIKAQYVSGDKVVVPTEDQNLVGTQTTGSEHYFVPPNEEDQLEEDTEEYNGTVKSEQEIFDIRGSFGNPVENTTPARPILDTLGTDIIPFAPEGKLDTEYPSAGFEQAKAVSAGHEGSLKHTPEESLPASVMTQNSAPPVENVEVVSVEEPVVSLKEAPQKRVSLMQVVPEVSVEPAVSTEPAASTEEHPADNVTT